MRSNYYLRVGQWEFDSFSQISDLIGESSDIRVLNIAWVLSKHIVDIGVHLSGQDPHDCISSHIERNSHAWLQFRFVDLGSAAHDVARTARGLHHYLLLRDFLEHLSDVLTDCLDVLQVLLSLFELLFLLLLLEFHYRRLRVCNLQFLNLCC